MNRAIQTIRRLDREMKIKQLVAFRRPKLQPYKKREKMSPIHFSVSEKQMVWLLGRAGLWHDGNLSAALRELIDAVMAGETE